MSSSAPATSPTPCSFASRPEKSLKAFLTWQERASRRTHDLEELGEACRAIDGTLAALLEQADVLWDFAWNCATPERVYTPELEEAEAMFGIAGDIFGEIQLRLHAEGVCAAAGRWELRRVLPPGHSEREPEILRSAPRMADCGNMSKDEEMGIWRAKREPVTRAKWIARDGS